MSIVEVTERTRFSPQTDGQRDGRRETSIPPFQPRWSKGYKYFIVLVFNLMISKHFAVIQWLLSDICMVLQILATPVAALTDICKFLEKSFYKICDKAKWYFYWILNAHLKSFLNWVTATNLVALHVVILVWREVNSSDLVLQINNHFQNK